jgi:hypothetical protein
MIVATANASMLCPEGKLPFPRMYEVGELLVANQPEAG